MSVAVEELFVECDGAVLAGSFWSPDPRPRSVVVMHPGSGPSDRHNDVHFPPIRSALLDAGHGVASFDKRGVAASTGSLLTSSIEEQARDLLGCVAVLRSRVPDVSIGAFGHSQGGWVVYEATGTSDDIDVAITNSGPGVSVLEQERHALRVATEGHADHTDALELFEELAASARARQPFAEVVADVDADRAGSLEGFAAQVLADEGEWGLTCQLLAYDPATALASISVPVLAVFGAEDPLVPVDDSLAALRRHVSARCLETRVFDGAGHRLEPVDGQGLAEGYLDALVEFATRCAERPPTR